MKREELVEIQSAPTPSRPATTPLPSPTPRQSSVSRKIAPETIKPAATSLQNAPLQPPVAQPTRVVSSAAPRLVTSFSGIEFFGPESAFALDRGELRGALIYAVPNTVVQPYDPSLIELGLPVARSGIRPGQEPSTWPSYRTFNSSQRSYYLDWLVSGRRTPDTPQAYVALYVQGLERRVLCDGKDHRAVAIELLGLLSVYGKATSFRRDLTSLLWLTIQLSCDTLPVSSDIVETAVRQTSDWNEFLLRYCLATQAQLQRPISIELARVISANNPQAISSVVQQRHVEKFQSLFEKRIGETFPQGLYLELGKRAEKLEYLVLNPTLTRLSRSETHLEARRRVPDDCPPIQTLITLWGRCTNELKAYDRAHRAAEEGELTTEMWEALPEIARDREHPEREAWSKLIQQGFSEHNRPLVRIENLASIKKFEARGRLTKKQTEQLLTTAFHLNFAMEPDARMLGRNYAWDEAVAIFPRRDDAPEDLATFNAASILLRLGVHIAAADGEIDPAELQRITAHLSQQFELTSTSADRLEHLRYALIHSPSLVGTLEKSLQEKLKPEQRQVVGEFLIGIAIADGTISPGELKALKKAWQALGLEQKTLDELLRPTQVETKSPIATTVNETIVLDHDRIAQIMQDTQRVAEMLRTAMQDDAESEMEQEPLANPAKSLSPRLDTAGRGVGGEGQGNRDLIPPTPDVVPRVTEATGEVRTALPVSEQEALESLPPAMESHVEVSVDDEAAESLPTMGTDAMPRDPREPQVVPPSGPVLWQGLAVRYHSFLTELLTKSVWDRKSLDQVARGQGLMLGGALEAINEWLSETRDDWLTSEEGDEIQVQTHLLK